MKIPTESSITKADLVSIVSAKTFTSAKDTEITINSLLEVLIESLLKGNRIELRGLGAFDVKTTKPRVGRNPKTGESVNVPSRRAVKFKPGKLIKQGLIG